MSKIIDYDNMLNNTKQIINALEFDCMRSGGKVKFNVVTLNELYDLEERLEKKLAEAKKPAPKKTPTKEG